MPDASWLATVPADGLQFMQNASNTSRKPTTPASEPSLKRRKTDHTPDSSAPTTPASEPKAFVDRSEVRAALKAESAYEALVASRRAELGFANNEYETQWVLDVKLPVQNGGEATEEDAESSQDEGDEWPGSNGRQTYGSFKRKKNAGTASSTTNAPARQGPAIDLISDEDEDEDEEEGELTDSDEDTRPTPSQQKKRKAAVMDLTNDAAMSALDTVDLSRSSYARSKGAHGAPARPFQRDRGSHPKDRRGEKHPKKNKNPNRSKKR